MHQFLAVCVVCCTLSLASAAPQDKPTYAVNENVVEEEPPSTVITENTESSDSSTKKATEETPEETIVAQEPQSTTQINKDETGTQKPATVAVTAATVQKVTTKKPVRKTTTKPLAEESPVTVPVEASTASSPIRRLPCRCGEGTCSCCSGLILENLNVPIRSKACANVTYEPEDFAFNFKLLFNDRVLYNNKMSAKNPRPVCIPINRFFGIKMCAKLSNIYMSGRNIHACLDMEGYWDDESAFQYSFNCFRIGSNGVAVVRPEDGGGLPPPPDEEEQTDEDYDDSARGWTGDVEVVEN